MKPIIIIGSGHAGITLAREIRGKDSAVPIVIVTQEKGDLYYKPNLSKALTMGKTLEALIMKTSDALRNEFSLDIRSETEVTSVDTLKQSITIMHKGKAESLVYRALVFATGAAPIDLGLSSEHSEKVVSINNLDDYRRFISQLKKKMRILIIGAGYVGCEFASDLASTGHQIDVVDLSMWPLQRVLPQSLGTKIVEAFPKDQVRWHFGCSIRNVTEKNNLVSVELSSGKVIEVDLAISAVGLSPNKSLAESAGIKVNNGIVVDQHLKTSANKVYALGDCAEYYGCILPFIAPATAAAKALAQILVGDQQTLTLPPQAVAVKLAYCPLVICPPQVARGSTLVGSWQVDGEGADLSAVFYDLEGTAHGFALLGNTITRKNELLKRVH